MNLTHEAVTSIIWLIKTLVITIICSGIVGYFIIKYTLWGKQFWLLSRDYFSLKRSKSPVLSYILIIFFSLATVRLNVLFSNWYNAMYDALQKLNASAFWTEMIWFSILATFWVITNLLVYYFQHAFIIKWRTWLNANILEKYIHNHAYYKTQYGKYTIENPDQRIQQDILEFATNFINLSTQAINSVVSVIAFTIILWNLSGSLEIVGHTIPHLMVFLVFIYVLIFSVFAFKIGRPLIKLNFDKEKLTANYRYSLIRLKEYAESIAFYRGEKVEKNLLHSQFGLVIQNAWNIIYRTLRFNGFNFTISQISVIFPFIIQASRFFSKKITLGDLLQTAQAFGQVHDSLSFFRNNYDTFTSFRATLNRLTQFIEHVEQCQHSEDIQVETHQNAIIFDNVNVKRPDDSPLFQSALNLSIPAGTKVLIQGPSGAGKTTILRTAAGIWHHADGVVYRPENNIFLSQRPYLPQGSLIGALYYPQEVPDDEIAIANAKEVLQKVKLEYLSEQLLQSNDWNRTLSPGEQQRLAIARLILHKPDVIFLDEATSSLDEDLEFEMYQLINQELPTSTIISVGHRSTLITHHNNKLTLNADGSWVYTTL